MAGLLDFSRWPDGGNGLLGLLGMPGLGGALREVADPRLAGQRRASQTFESMMPLLMGQQAQQPQPSMMQQPTMPQPQMDATAPIGTTSPGTATQPRGYRNNNPLNIEAGSFTSSQPGFAGSDGRFAQFASLDQGVGAANNLLDVYQNKHGLNTVNGIVSRWAPAGDGNNVSAYAANVAKQIGVDPNAPLGPEHRQALIAAMAQHENGRPLPQMAQAPQMAPQQPGMSPKMQGLMRMLTIPNLPEGQRKLAEMLLQNELAGAKGTDDIKEFEYAKRQGFGGTLEQWIQRKRSGAGEYGLQPIWGTDAEGNPALMQLGKSGEAIRSKLPEGVRPGKDAIRIDAGTHTVLLDPVTRQQIGVIPKNLVETEKQKLVGKGQGEASESLASMSSKLPGLMSVVGTLDKLAEKATYTLGGQITDAAMRQAGMEPREAAVARSRYIAMVDNQILPLLRDTFGAQFTEREGNTLRLTLGDPDKGPKEKQAILKSFIEQKKRDIEALRSRVGGETGGSSQDGWRDLGNGVRIREKR